MTMTTMREDRARPAGRLGIVCKCNQSTTRVSMYLMGLGTEELSQTSQIDWESEREGRTQAARSNDQKGKRQRRYSINNGLC